MTAAQSFHIYPRNQRFLGDIFTLAPIPTQFEIYFESLQLIFLRETRQLYVLLLSFRAFTLPNCSRRVNVEAGRHNQQRARNANRYLTHRTDVVNMSAVVSTSSLSARVALSSNVTTPRSAKTSVAANPRRHLRRAQTRVVAMASPSKDATETALAKPFEVRTNIQYAIRTTASRTRVMRATSSRRRPPRG